MGCGDVRLLRTIGGVYFTGQERAALNKLTMPRATNLLVQAQGQRRYNFTDPGGDADRLFEFYRAIEDARARLAEGAQPAGAAAAPPAP